MTGAEVILSRCVREADCMIWQGARNSSGYGSVGGGVKGKTHCKRGHLLSGENVRLYKRSTGLTDRICRSCKRGES